MKYRETHEFVKAIDTIFDLEASGNPPKSDDKIAKQIRESSELLSGINGNYVFRFRKQENIPSQPVRAHNQREGKS
jgi:hypothetical protein